MNDPLNHAPDWDAIDDVLLDLDGTLLDLAYDNFIWLGRIPELYAEARGLSIPEAQAALAPRFRELQGTLSWYSIDFWSRELEIDVLALHREEQARVAWLPGARGFLETLRARGKRLVLLTNSHPSILAIKHERTRVLDHFDAGYSSHEFGAPKEDARFWAALGSREPHEPSRCLFVDDSDSVLRAARAAGRRVALIVNERGEAGVDNQLASRLGFDVTELLGGCICCSLVADLAPALESLAATRQPDLVIVEPSGIAEPGQIRAALRYARVPGLEMLSVGIVDAQRIDERFPDLVKDLIRTRHGTHLPDRVAPPTPTAATPETSLTAE